MEQPTPSFQSFIRTNAPIPQKNPSKPLPPVPTYLRRSSSVYSGKSAWSLEEHDPIHNRLHFTDAFSQSMIFGYNETNIAQPNLEPEPLYFLEPKTYVPPVAARHHQYSFPISSSPSQTPSDDDDSLLLPNEWHAVNKSMNPSASRASAEEFSQPQYSSAPETKFFEDDHETFYMQEQGMYRLPELEPSPMTSAVFSEGEEVLEAQPLPDQHAKITEKGLHTRVRSQEKAFIAMGIESKKVKNESDHQVHHYGTSHKLQPPSSKLRQDPTQAVDESQPQELPLFMIPSRGSHASITSCEADSETDSVDSQIFARDYHEHLTSQSRNERLSRGPYYEGNPKAAMRMLSAPLFFQKQAEIHKNTTAGKDPPKTNHIFKSRSSKKLGTPPNALGSFFNSAMDKAKEGFSSLASTNHSDEESPTGRMAVGRSRDEGERYPRRRKSSAQKRRDELKGKIRIVGKVDPAAVALADRLESVELGKLKANMR